MTEQQANELANLIGAQFPFHTVRVQQNAHKNYAIAIWADTNPPSNTLLIHSRSEWDKALLVWYAILFSVD